MKNHKLEFVLNTCQELTDLPAVLLPDRSFHQFRASKPVGRRTTLCTSETSINRLRLENGGKFGRTLLRTHTTYYIVSKDTGTHPGFTSWYELQYPHSVCCRHPTLLYPTRFPDNIIHATKERPNK